jgi:hypothetical protein
MTHTQLLESINAQELLPIDYRKALYEIAELHTYVLTGHKMRGKSGLSKRCTECGFSYPCSTIEIVQRQLQL